MQRRGPSSGSYGRACVGCFKMKCKCVTREDGDGCERCHRLNRPCQSGDELRRRTKAKRQDPNKRIAELEGKLGGLVSLLQARNVLDADLEAMPTNVANIEQQELVNGAEDYESSEDGGETVIPDRSSKSPPRDSFLRPPAASAVAGLDRFRSTMLHYLPFINLPGSIRAEELQRERPLLFKAILCVASQSSQRSRQDANGLKRMLCEAAFLRQRVADNRGDTESRMDLLQALLVYIAWGWDQVHGVGSPSRLMTIAISLVGEMRLDKSIPSDAHAFRLFDHRFQDKQAAFNDSVSALPVLESQRALLGCFLLSSAVASCFGEIEPLRWTPKMETALETLSSSEECALDAILVLQVHLQHLATKAAEARTHPGADETQYTKHIAVMLGELKDLRPSFPDAGPATSLPATAAMHTRLLVAHSYYIEVDAIGAMYPMIPVFGHLKMDSLSYFRQAVFAVEACTSGLLAIPASQFVGISFLQWVQLTRCVAVLHHLHLLQDPGWNLTAIRAVVDLSNLLHHILEKLDQAARKTGRQDGNNVFMLLAQGLRKFGSGIEGNRTSPDKRQPSATSADTSASLAPQKGYFRNPRFWMENYFDPAGYSWAGSRTNAP
ncbi:hypothetical protein GE09DRAFT_305542 [Coniochaeta sp. 2T2.1]|nr:hypothetical protein GE09DRAFT_305542 [Coniochaeta sp. 2T2.1]